MGVYSRRCLGEKRRGGGLLKRLWEVGQYVHKGGGVEEVDIGGIRWWGECALGGRGTWEVGEYEVGYGNGMGERVRV